jgi:hypothetical protein
MLKICKLKLLLVLAWYFPPFFAPPRILYTCSAQAEPDHETALGALDLAHRWQVEVVVEILTDLLAGTHLLTGA